MRLKMMVVLADW